MRTQKWAWFKYNQIDMLASFNNSNIDEIMIYSVCRVDVISFSNASGFGYLDMTVQRPKLR